MISTTLRPNSTIRQSANTTIFGAAATVAAAVADDDDSTFVRHRAAGFAKVGFPGYDLPTGAIVYGVNVRLRARCDTATSITTTINGASTGFPYSPAVGSAFRTDAGFTAMSGLSVQAVENGLALQWNSADEVEIAAVYLDLQAVERPVVNVLTPSAPFATSQPEIAWDESGDFPQSQYQVKIFTQNQYEAVGFDPTNSAALYDSGAQLGTANSLTPTVNLANGVTYRFYARGAQDVNGATQWSAWDFTQQPMSAPSAPVPTVVAVADDDLARIKLTITDG